MSVLEDPGNSIVVGAEAVEYRPMGLLCQIIDFHLTLHRVHATSANSQNTEQYQTVHYLWSRYFSGGKENLWSALRSNTKHMRDVLTMLSHKFGISFQGHIPPPSSRTCIVRRGLHRGNKSRLTLT